MLHWELSWNESNSRCTINLNCKKLHHAPHITHMTLQPQKLQHDDEDDVGGKSSLWDYDEWLSETVMAAHKQRIIPCIYNRVSTKNLIANKLISNNINNLLYCAPSQVCFFFTRDLYALADAARVYVSTTISTHSHFFVLPLSPPPSPLMVEHNSIKEWRLRERYVSENLNGWHHKNWGSTHKTMLWSSIDDVVYSLAQTLIVSNSFTEKCEGFYTVDDRARTLGKYLHILLAFVFRWDRLRCLWRSVHVSAYSLSVCLLLNYTTHNTLYTHSPNDFIDAITIKKLCSRRFFCFSCVYLLSKVYSVFIDLLFYNRVFNMS